MEPLVTGACTVPPWVGDMVDAICNRRLMEVVEVAFQLGSWMLLVYGCLIAMAVANDLEFCSPRGSRSCLEGGEQSPVWSVDPARYLQLKKP